MRQLYLAATGMNRGKTTVALGLLQALHERGINTGFTKPVGSATRWSAVSPPTKTRS
jgi:BioD-like phosphotransacetylase family protein